VTEEGTWDEHIRARMRDHYAKRRATELAAISNPEDFFEQLGLQISEEVRTLADQIAGLHRPGYGCG